MPRNYSNIALDTTLVAGIGAGNLTCTVTSATGYPAAPFAIVLDPGLVTEEVCQVTLVVGTVFTITRGFDGTVAAAHALAAVVRHAAIAGDFTDLQTADTTEASARAAADALLAPKASPTFTGVPAAPTAAPGTNTTQLATTAFVTGSFQPLDADLTAIAALASAADQLPYATGAQAWALTTLTAYIRTLLDDVDAATARATLLAAGPEGRLKVGGTTFYTIPGVEISSVGSQLVSADFLYYHAFYVATPITIDQMAIEVSGTAAGGKLSRFGLYTADTNYQPVTLLADSGAVAADALGVKTAAVNLPLAQGWYVSCTVSNGAPTYRTYRGGSRYMGLATALGANALNKESFAAFVFAALPATPTVATGANGSATPPDHHVVFRVSVP